ncbi:uncharacterized protein BJ212DRAFT_868061 [Suillus subaureus]|uniref:Uncharacterized protein n=1 Tax=Suillus subaureus TaxID=48587 RepID=A0A9P7J6S0_9AGAM|nr:uncharacterized protein BJ212DRAFT_868061 [Suillus subaureus]KAG1805461.1 hypothetical protein BJ212DRAFT_868061 [Suillus subaureus]
MHSLNPSTLLALRPLHTTLPPTHLASSSSFDELVEIVREYEANEKKAMAEVVAHAIVQPIPLRRPNATVEESKVNVFAPTSGCTGTEVSRWDEPAASFEDMDVYLNYFDEDEEEITQPYSLVQSNASPMLGWVPPSGCEDIEVGHEDLTCSSPISNSTLHHVPQAFDKPVHVQTYLATLATDVRAASKPSPHPPAQLPRTRVVLASTQRTGAKNKSRDRQAKSRVSCGYGQPPRGGIPPALARDVTKSHALRVEQEHKRMRAAAARAGEGRKPSVLQRANVETEDGMARIC